MESISLRVVPAIVFVFTAAFFLTPVAPAKSNGKANLTRILKSTQKITLAEARPKTNETRSELIRQYLADIFGVPDFKTSWYDNIMDVQVTGDTAIIRTNLSRGDKKISNICGVVSGFVYSHLNAQLGIRKVKILGSSGEVIVFRRSVLDDCPS